MPPRKRAKVSATQTIPEAIRVVQMMDLPPSPISPAMTTDVTMPSVISEQGKTLTTYLVCCLDLQEQLLGELTADKKNLKEQNDFFNVSTADLKKLAEEVNRKLENSERQVTYLWQLKESKVHTLMIKLATEKAHTAIVNSKTASKTTQVSVLIGRSD
jgi:hypothetical protein